MALVATDAGGGTPREPIPAGIQTAICWSIYDVGTQSYEFEGNMIIQRKIIIIWEVPAHRPKIEKDGVEKDLPMVISEEYTLSLNEKANLRKALESWRGKVFTLEELKGFDLRNVMGKTCQLQIIHKPKKNGDIFAKIQNVLPAPEGVTLKNPENPPVYYDMEENKFDFPPEMLPWVFKKIQLSAEYVAFNAPSYGEGKNQPVAVPAGEVVAPPDTGVDTKGNEIPF